MNQVHNPEDGAAEEEQRGGEEDRQHNAEEEIGEEEDRESADGVENDDGVDIIGVDNENSENADGDGDESQRMEVNDNDDSVLVSGGNEDESDASVRESVNEREGMVGNYILQSTFDDELNDAGAGTSDRRNERRVIRSGRNVCEKFKEEFKNRIRYVSHLKRCPRK